MGGLEIDENYAVLGSVSEAIGGLNATGEVARGVHGNYRSGGNSSGLRGFSAVWQEELVPGTC